MGTFRPTPGLIAGALIALATLLLLGLRLSVPAPRTIDIGAPGDAYVAQSFYGAETAGSTSFRWSGPFSALRLPVLAADRLMVQLRLRGGPGESPLYLRIRGQEHQVALDTSNDWRIYHLLIERSLPAVGTWGMIELLGNLAPPGPDDPRSLGVALDWLRVLPLRGGWVLLGGLAQASMYAWVVALLGSALWLAQRRLSPAAGPVDVARRSWGPAGVLAAGLVAWAWRDSYSLLWALPLAPGPLLAASLALAAGWALPARLRLWPAGRPLGLALVGGGLALAHLALALPPPAPWAGLAALLILWAPGALLSLLLLRDEPDPAARALLALCGALAGQILLLLLMNLLPGGIRGWALILSCDLISLAAVGLLARGGRRPPRPARPASPRQRAWPAAVLLVLLLAAALRLPLLGSAELHDDESSVLIGATQLVAGGFAPLMTQLKGPAQVLLPAGPLAITGQLGEQVARLPFAAAGLGVVLGGMLIGRRLGGLVGGAAAGVFLALDGFMIAFSRIVQYQSLVLLLTLGALWCCWRFYRGAPAWRSYLCGAALLYAVALLGHYDAVFGAPALGWLVLAGGLRRGWAPRQWLGALLPPALVAGLPLAGFYLPFVLHPHFSATLSHLGERTGQQGGAALFNNLATTAALAGFYQSPAQLWLLAALLLGATAAALLRWLRPRPLTWPLLGLLLLGSAGLLWIPALPPALALAIFALPLAAIGLAPGVPAADRALWLWFAGAALGMLFLVAQPRTHVYVAVLPAALLAGQAIAGLARPLGRLARGPAALLALGLPLLLALGLHQATLFLRQSPEYVRLYPAALLLGSASDPLDPNARFGFPVRDGWKVVGELYRSGELRGAFASNQSSEVLAWYTGGLRRCDARPAYALVALAEPNPAIPADAELLGVVQVAGESRIAIYRWGPVEGGPRVFALEEYLAAYDAHPTPLILPAQQACAASPP